MSILISPKENVSLREPLMDPETNQALDVLNVDEEHQQEGGNGDNHVDVDEDTMIIGARKFMSGVAFGLIQANVVLSITMSHETALFFLKQSQLHDDAAEHIIGYSALFILQCVWSIIGMYWNFVYIRTQLWTMKEYPEMIIGVITSIIFYYLIYHSINYNELSWTTHKGAVSLVQE